MSPLSFEAYLNQAPYAFFRWQNTENWPVIYASEAADRLLGYAVSDWTTGKVQYADIVHPEDKQLVIDELTEAAEKGLESIVHAPYRLKTQDDRWIWIKDYTQIIRDDQGRVIEYYGFLEDLTDFLAYKAQAKATQQINDQMNNALDQSNLISRSDQYGNITYVNNNLLNLTGYSRDELIGQPHNILRHPDTPTNVFKEMWQTIQSNRVWKGTLKNRKKNGEPYYVEMTLVPLVDDQGRFIEYLAIRHEVTGLITKQMDLETAVKTSRLLNIPNRVALLEAIETLEHPQLALFDLDNFKQVNEYFGHQFGDQMLISTLLHLFLYKPLDTRVYHLGSDQLVLTSEEPDAQRFEQQMIQLRNRLSNHKITVQSQDIYINQTLALSFEPKENLLNSLEVAMRHAKNTHQDVLVYSSAIDTYQQRADNLMWSEKLDQALLEDRITTFFQPILNLRSGRIEKHEALVRMIEPDDKVISPFFFLEVSQQTKKYPILSKRVVAKAFQAFKRSEQAFSINISATDMTNPDYVDYLLKHVEQFSHPERITLEILESEEITDFVKVEKFIDQLRGLGCKIAIDDFGAGYANFENLLKLHADFIKIDGSLIKQLAENQDAYDIVESIVSFAKKKDIQTIAEFVSSADILDAVKRLDIDFAQGYFIGEPAKSPMDAPEL